MTNLNNLEIYDGQLFASNRSGTNPGVWSVGSGLPTASGNTMTELFSSPSVYGFYLADLNPSVPGLDTAYVADDTKGIEKFTFNGSTWTQVGTAVGGTAAAYRGMTGEVTANGVQLFLTGQGTNPGVYGYADNSGFGGSLTGTPTLIAALPNATNEVFRGIDFVPTPEPSTLVLGALGLGSLAIVARRRGRSEK